MKFSYLKLTALVALCLLPGTGVGARFYRGMDLNGQPITNAATPTASSPGHQVATKAYVDALTNALGPSGTDLSAVSNQFVLKSGDTLTGALTLPGAPTGTNQAATKKYVDDAAAVISNAAALDAAAKASAAQAAAVTNAAADAAAKAATAQTNANAYTDAATNGLAQTTAGTYVKKAGDTMTGILDLGGNLITNLGTPVRADMAATKGYADALAAVPVTQLKYVDGNRTDSYTPDGSARLPFKTIQAALDSISDAADVKKYLVLVAPGRYNDPITLKAYVSLRGHGNEYTRLGGTIAGTFAGASVRVMLSDFSIYGNFTWSVTASASKLGLERCDVHGNLTVTGSSRADDFFDALDCIFWKPVGLTRVQASLYRCDAYANITANNGDIWYLSGELAAGLVLNNTSYACVADLHPDVGAMYVVATGTTLEIDAGSLSGATLLRTGSVIYREVASAIANDSGVDGETIKDALEALKNGTMPAVSNQFVLKSGDTMTGALSLTGAPTAGAHAANKAYVDATTNAAVATAKADATAKANAAQANAIAAANAYTDAATNGILIDAQGLFVHKAGDTMTGNLLLAGGTRVGIGTATPLAPLHVAGDAICEQTFSVPKVVFMSGLGGATNTYAIGKDNRLEIHVDGEMAVKF